MYIKALRLGTHLHEGYQCKVLITIFITLQNGITITIIYELPNVVVNSNYQIWFYIYIYIGVTRYMQGCARYNYLFSKADYYSMLPFFIW
jgi:hypothetical protein